MSIVFALIPMFAWGSIGLVSGKLGGDANQQTLGMTIGAFVCCQDFAGQLVKMVNFME